MRASIRRMLRTLRNAAPMTLAEIEPRLEGRADHMAESVAIAMERQWIVADGDTYAITERGKHVIDTL